MKRKLSMAFSLAVIMALVLATGVFADNVVNDLVIGGNDNFVVGGSTTINYWIVKNNGDGQSGCNASDSTAAIVTINVPTGLTATPSSLTFTECGSSQAVTFTATGPGTYPISADVDDDGTGTYNTNPSAKTLTVTAPVPSDTTPPVITPNVSGTLGLHGWYISDVTVSWDVIDDGSTITSTSGCGATTLSSETTGTTLTCSATSAGGTNSQSVTVKIDKSGPSALLAVKTGTPGWTPWYISDVVIGTSGTDSISSPVSCTSDQELKVDTFSTIFSGSCTNAAGLTTLATDLSVSRDATLPIIKALLDINADINTGWYNLLTGAPTVSFQCSDATSGVFSCPVTHKFIEGTALSYSATAFDNASNSASTGFEDINVDLTNPEITAELDRLADLDTGWFNIMTGAPIVQFTCSDDGSGIVSCPDKHTMGEGEAQSFSATVFDNAGNSASAGVEDVNVDISKPLITAKLDIDPASSGWFNISTGVPTVKFECSDGVSGISICPTNYKMSEGEDQSYSDIAFDNAGNSASAGVTDVDVDLTAPAITWIGGPADGSSFYFGFGPDAPTCSATDDLSGSANDCTVSAYVTTVGPHTIKATTHDLAGNETVESRTYTVLQWDLKGFYQPVDMPNTWNSVKNGSTVPFKFEIFAGTQELNSLSYVKNFAATPIVCPISSFLADPIEFTTTGATSLRYDAVAGQFINNWQTPKKAGSCYSVTMTTMDGSSLSAWFRLK